MPVTNFEFDAFADEFTLSDDADGNAWPAMEVEINFTFHPSEPDVGIFHSQLAIIKTTCQLGGVTYADEDAFAAAVYEAIAGDIEEDAATVAEKIRAQIDVWECDCEEADVEDDSDRD